MGISSLLKTRTLYAAVIFLSFVHLLSDDVLFPFVNNITDPLSQMEKYCIPKLPPMENLMILIFIYKQLILIWRCFPCLSYSALVIFFLQCYCGSCPAYFYAAIGIFFFILRFLILSVIFQSFFFPG